jgi:hypothetical protein
VATKSAGRLLGNNKAKAVVLAMVQLERVQSAVDKCLVEATSGKDTMDKKSDARWKEISIYYLSIIIH